MTQTWRQISAAHIAKVVHDNPDVVDEKELRKLISAAYPFGERAYYPYKAWLAAVKDFFASPDVPKQARRQPSEADWRDTPLFSNISNPS